MLIIGPTGSSKSTSISEILKRNYSNEQQAHQIIALTGNISAAQLQLIIESQMKTKKNKYTYLPSDQ